MRYVLLLITLLMFGAACESRQEAAREGAANVAQEKREAQDETARARMNLEQAQREGEDLADARENLREEKREGQKEVQEAKWDMREEIEEE